MKEHEARELLPGSGDLQEKLNEMHGKYGAPECEDFTIEQSTELLEWLLDWVVTADDDDDDIDIDIDEDDEGPEPERKESDRDDN